MRWTGKSMDILVYCALTESFLLVYYTVAKTCYGMSFRPYKCRHLQGNNNIVAVVWATVRLSDRTSLANIS
jgi:hypothetical protein